MDGFRRVSLLAFALTLALAAGALAQSQATTGVIEGTVTADNGQGVAGAEVTLTNTGTNFEKKIPTDEGGRFHAVLLPLGAYRVTVAKEGFANLVREGLDLTVGHFDEHERAAPDQGERTEEHDRAAARHLCVLTIRRHLA